ncbi:DUF5362 family protein [Kiritimatiella glycovorans]|uniref:GYF domain-containing protein n=1 Tax=Kiritimatiella glycovorans TaxID=1307763 RepID=A0A0G3EG78_9BACT|nr:DUF5362 family protein [Kiritimatiella glycovorans]AKJ64407.1 hypothetical protein L21SP4_01158 [Kiritimatiella glycovorans]
MESQWYYADRKNQPSGPFAPSRIREMIRNGDLNQDTLLWREGMQTWTPLRRTEFSRTAAGATSRTAPAGGARNVPAGLRGWMAFIGIYHVVTGILACLTIIGAIWGVPMIISGVALFGAKRELDDGPDPATLYQKLRSHFAAYGFLLLLGLIGTLIYLVLAATVFGSVAARMMHSMPSVGG